MKKVPQNRNAEDTVKHMKGAIKSGKPFLEVKNPLPLINLTFYIIIFGCVPDSMHCIAGIAKQFTTIWFGTKQKVGLFPRSKILEVDKLLSNIKVPHQIGRLTRLLSEKVF